MKTSNKILLCLFLLPFAAAIFVYSSLYAKFRNNDYVTEAQLDEESHITSTIGSFNNIDVSGYKGHITIKHGDHFALKFEKWNKDRFSYEIKDNKLFINTKADYDNPITILCPGFERLLADSSSIFVDSIHLKHVFFDLGHNTSLNFNGHADTLTADISSGAGMDLNNNATVGVLNLTIDNHASFENNTGIITQFGKMQLQDSAELRVDGKTLRLLFEKNTPSQQ